MNRFAVFLHVDLRSDGSIAATSCDWTQRSASECWTALDCMNNKGELGIPGRELMRIFLFPPTAAAGDGWWMDGS